MPATALRPPRDRAFQYATVPVAPTCLGAAERDDHINLRGRLRPGPRGMGCDRPGVPEAHPHGRGHLVDRRAPTVAFPGLLQSGLLGVGEVDAVADHLARIPVGAGGLRTAGTAEELVTGSVGGNRLCRHGCGDDHCHDKQDASLRNPHLSTVRRVATSWRRGLCRRSVRTGVGHRHGTKPRAQLQRVCSPPLLAQRSTSTINGAWSLGGGVPSCRSCGPPGR